MTGGSAAAGRAIVTGKQCSTPHEPVRQSAHHLGPPPSRAACMQPDARSATPHTSSAPHPISACTGIGTATGSRASTAGTVIRTGSTAAAATMTATARAAAHDPARASAAAAAAEGATAASAAAAAAPHPRPCAAARARPHSGMCCQRMVWCRRPACRRLLRRSRRLQVRRASWAGAYGRYAPLNMQLTLCILCTLCAAHVLSPLC